MADSSLAAVLYDINKAPINRNSAAMVKPLEEGRFICEASLKKLFCVWAVWQADLC